MRARLTRLLALAAVVAGGLVLVTAPPASAEHSVEGVSPGAVSNEGTVTVTVTGSGFETGAQVQVERTVSNDQWEEDFVVEGRSEVVRSGGTEVSAQLDMAGHAPGSWDVVVTNAGGDAARAAGALQVFGSTPVVSSVAPPQAPDDAGTMTVQIHGENLSRGDQVEFDDDTLQTTDDIGVNSVTWVSRTRLDAEIEIPGRNGGLNETRGEKDVIVTSTADAESPTCTACFEIVPPVADPHVDDGDSATGDEIIFVETAQGAQNVVFDITGTDFQNGATVTSNLEGVTVTGVEFVSSTRLRVTMDLDQESDTTGTTTHGRLTVTNPDGGSDECGNDDTGPSASYDCMLVGDGPEFESITPQGGDNSRIMRNVRIEGEELFEDSTYRLERPGSSHRVMTVTNFEEDTVTDPDIVHGDVDLTGAAPGAWDLRIINPDGGQWLEDGAFTVTGVGPTVDSVAPAGGDQGERLTGVRVAGSNFFEGVEVSFGRGVDVTVQDVERTEITVDLDIANTAPPGAHDVTVTNSDGQQATLPGGFAVQPSGSLFLIYNAYGEFSNGGFVASGDVDGNGVDEVVTGVNVGGGPHVVVWDVTGGTAEAVESFFAYDPAFRGGVRVATGDVDGDGTDEVITAAGPGGGPHVVAWGVDGRRDTAPVVERSFFAFDRSFTGGVYVAAGDVVGTEAAEVAVSRGAGAPSRVRVFSTASQVAQVAEFAPYGGFTGGAEVAVGDTTGNGRAEVITGAQVGGGPHVVATEVPAPGSTQVVDSFFAYDPNFRGGVNVGVGDVDGDGRPDIVTGAGPGGGPHVKAFGRPGGGGRQVVLSFVERRGSGYANGIEVGAGNVNGGDKDEVITAPQQGSRVEVWIHQR